MIQLVEVYETKDKQFRTMKAAIQHRENLIEEFIRRLPGFNGMPPKDRIKFIQAVIDNRKELTDLFDYDLLKDTDDDE